MAELDARVTVQDVMVQLDKEKKEADQAHRKEKDDESKSYYSGQLDLIERLEAFISV